LTKPIEITQTELALILEALEDAAYYRETRSRVLTTVSRRHNKRQGTLHVAPPDAEGHRRKAQAYAAVAARLKAEREPG